jgi:peptidoglycan hydrolase-like protein with peptidoglycan-binding domain
MKSGMVTIAAFLLLAPAAWPAVAQQSVSVSQLNMSAVPKLDPEGIRKVQSLLRQKGFDPGPLDGIAGPLTKTAVRKFQEKFGMKASAEIDNQVLLGLGAVDLAGNE